MRTPWRNDEVAHRPAGGDALSIIDNKLNPAPRKPHDPVERKDPTMLGHRPTWLDLCDDPSPHGPTQNCEYHNSMTGSSL